MANICPLFSEVFDGPAQVLMHKSTVMYIYLPSCTGWCFSAAGGLFVSCSCEEWQMEPSLWQFGRTVCRRGCFSLCSCQSTASCTEPIHQTPTMSRRSHGRLMNAFTCLSTDELLEPWLPALHFYNKSSLGSAFISIYLWSIKSIHREDFLFLVKVNILKYMSYIIAVFLLCIHH